MALLLYFIQYIFASTRQEINIRKGKITTEII